MINKGGSVRAPTLHLGLAYQTGATLCAPTWLVSCEEMEKAPKLEVEALKLELEALKLELGESVELLKDLKATLTDCFGGNESS